MQTAQLKCSLFKRDNNEGLQLTGVECKTTAVDCVAQSYNWEANSRLASQVIPHVLWSLRPYYLVHKSPTGPRTESGECSSHLPVIFLKYQQYVSEVVRLLHAFMPKFYTSVSFLLSKEVIQSPKSCLGVSWHINIK
jgi:hypothetical protein